MLDYDAERCVASARTQVSGNNTMLWRAKPEPKTYRLAQELKAPSFQKASAISPRERRGSVSIGVIDDEPFQPKQNLENVGYKVSLLGDIATVEAVKPHQVILCDLQGVGKQMDSKKQGSFLIKEIKDCYPDKYVVAYTGGAMNLLISRDASSSADAFLKKDVDIETWTDKLDDIITELLDPYRVWCRQRYALVNRDIDTLTILELEDAFVKSVSQGVAPSETTLAKFVSKSGVGADVRAIVQNLIASELFKLLVG